MLSFLSTSPLVDFARLSLDVRVLSWNASPKAAAAAQIGRHETSELRHRTQLDVLQAQPQSSDRMNSRRTFGFFTSPQHQSFASGRNPGMHTYAHHHIWWHSTQHSLHMQALPEEDLRSSKHRHEGALLL